MSDLTGHAVLQQANDNSLTNTEPAMIRGAILGLVGMVASILVIGGYIDESQKQALVDNVGVIIPAILLILPVLQAIWTRLAVYSPKTAAAIAVENAKITTSVPTLAPPP